MIEKHELAAIVNRLPTAVIAVDRKLRVQFANAKAMALFAPKRLDIGLPLPDAPFDTGFHAFVASLMERKTGALVRTIDASDNALSIVGIPPQQRNVAAVFIDDVSDRTRRERARTEFVANAAHELLTPLTGIASAAHVLDAGAKNEPELRDRFLSHIARECGRLTRIARGLLVLARAQADLEPPRLDLIELEPLLDDAVSAAPSGAVRVHCPPQLRVFVDRDLTETALSNLVSNAFRHSSDGAVDITVEDRRVGALEVVITNATHASSDETERRHERFATGGGRDGGGFGLGVSIASQALSAVGGRLSFEFDGGTTHARVELPTGGG